MYAIGVGDNVELPELMDLASDYRNVFTADDLNVLLSSAKIVTEIIKNDTTVGVTKGQTSFHFAFISNVYEITFPQLLSWIRHKYFYSIEINSYDIVFSRGAM